jgi:endonuclease V-like protein UPF0215 family
MRRLHLEKKGLRGLAIAESFRPNTTKSILCGIVMRRDFIVDGVIFGETTIKGDDATEKILQMFKELDRPDVSYLLISGLILSLYNIVDIKKIHNVLKIPVIGLTYRESYGIENSIKHNFPDSFEFKIKNYSNLNNREKININKTSEAFVRFEGCTIHEVQYLLKNLTLSGSIPEPIRVAKLIANSLIKKELSF